jgi:hypothetical protein
MRRGNGISGMCIKLLTFGLSEIRMGSNADDESGTGTSGRCPLAAHREDYRQSALSEVGAA